MRLSIVARTKCFPRASQQHDATAATATATSTGTNYAQGASTNDNTEMKPESATLPSGRSARAVSLLLLLLSLSCASSGLLTFKIRDWCRRRMGGSFLLPLLRAAAGWKPQRCSSLDVGLFALSLFSVSSRANKSSPVLYRQPGAQIWSPSSGDSRLIASSVGSEIPACRRTKTTRRGQQQQASELAKSAR